MTWADHVVILYPLWLGSMPALLKALLEQMLRPGFAYSTLKLGKWPVKFLRGQVRASSSRWDARAAIPLVFSRAQLAQPAAEHSQVRRLRVHPLDAHRQCRGPQQRQAHAVAQRFARPRACGGVSSPQGARPERAFSRLCNFRS